MHLRSMTGYGRSEVDESGLSLISEIKTLNHKYFELRVRLPGKYQMLEPWIRSLVKSKITRGSAELNLRLKVTEEHGSSLPRVDRELGAHYAFQASEILKTAGIKGEVSASEILRIPGVIRADLDEAPTDNEKKLVGHVIDQALDSLLDMRNEEGSKIAANLKGHLQKFENLVEKIKACPIDHENIRKNYFEKIKKVLGDAVSVDESRITLEAGILADRLDINEEIERLETHFKHTHEILDRDSSEEPTGRKLDFLFQEMHWETNTIMSKSSDAEVAAQAVEAKNLIEKMRELVQNIE